MGARMLYMVRLAVLALLAAIAVGCMSASTDQALAVSCRSYAATLSSLAELREADKLSADQVDAVNAARAIANPICLDGTVADNELYALADVLRGMSRIEVEARQ